MRLELGHAVRALAAEVSASIVQLVGDARQGGDGRADLSVRLRLRQPANEHTRHGIGWPKPGNAADASAHAVPAAHSSISFSTSRNRTTQSG